MVKLNRRSVTLTVLVLLGVAGVCLRSIPALNPLIAIEELDSPIRVKSMTDTHLILQDGRAIALRGMAHLPNQNPLFQEATSSGVELRPDGDVYGLVWVTAGAPVIPMWRKRSVNLAILAAALNPAGIDTALVDPKWLQGFTTDFRVQTLQDYGKRNRGLMGWHWSWLNCFQDDSKDAPWVSQPEIVRKSAS